MRFKAKIPGMSYLSEVRLDPLKMEFYFSKNKIFFTEEMKSRINEFSVDPFGVTHFKDGTNYTIQKTYHDKTDEPVYEVSFLKDCKYYLQVDPINKMKLRWIHKMTIFQKEPLAIIAIIISIIALFQKCN
jgi:hypothetical protein